MDSFIDSISDALGILFVIAIVVSSVFKHYRSIKKSRQKKSKKRQRGLLQLIEEMEMDNKTKNAAPKEKTNGILSPKNLRKTEVGKRPTAKVFNSDSITSTDYPNYDSNSEICVEDISTGENQSSLINLKDGLINESPKNLKPSSKDEWKRAFIASEIFNRKY